MNPIESSIIIRTFNEGQHIERLLKGILAQEYQSREIIIVDSGSTDRTLEIASGFPVQIVPIRKEDFTFGYALNVGCRAASGEYLVFVSGHTYPADRRWLGNIVAPFEDLRIGMVYGRQIGGETTKISEEKDMLNNFGTKSKILVEEAFGNNANAAIRKSLWNEIPYDEKLPGIEDIDWAHKIQKKGFYVYYRADAVIHHIHDETYAGIYRRFEREAMAYKAIFPNDPFNAKKSAVIYTLAILKDIYFGCSNKRSCRKILQTIPYRIAEYCGWRAGYLNIEEPAGDSKESTQCDLPKNRGVVIRSSNLHAIEEWDIPALHPEELLIQVAYAGVCSTDLDVMKGTLDYYTSGWAAYPITPGHEFSGTVVSAGSNVRGFRRGDKVVGECILGCGVCPSCRQGIPIVCPERREVGVLNFNGAYSRYIRMPARAVHRLPADAPLERACLIEPLAVSLRGIGRLLMGTNGTRGEAAVVGHGTIGTLCAQLMLRKGHQVSVFDRNPRKLLEKANGIRFETDLCSLNRFDYLIEATGSPEPLKKVLLESKTGARILLLGFPYAELGFNFQNLVAFDKAVIGSVGSTSGDFSKAIELYNGLDLERLVRNIFPLDDYERAWSLHRSGEITKAILRINGD